MGDNCIYNTTVDFLKVSYCIPS